MNSVKLVAGVRFKLDENIYTILKRLPGRKIEVQGQFNDIKVYSCDEIFKYLSNGILKFECKGKNIKKEEFSTEFSINDIDKEKFKDQAIFKYEAIRPIINLPYPHRTYKTIIQRVEEINSWADNPKLAQEMLNGCTFYKTVTYISLYRWINDYTESGGDFRSLMPAYSYSGGKDIPRASQEILDLIYDAIDQYYSTQQRISGKELRSIILEKIIEINKYSLKKLTCPSYATIARYLSKIPEFEKVSKRHGTKTAYNQFCPIHNGVDVTHPLERVEFDATDVNLMLIDENGEPLGSPYLVLAIDKCTTEAVGFSTGISNGVGWSEVLLSIKHMMTDKSYVKDMYPFINHEWNAYGKPETIVIDNGREFKNKAMMDASYQIGFELQFCPPKVPQWKASIERFFGITNTGLFHNAPGTTRSNYLQLGDNENPKKQAKLTFPVYLALLHKWIIDVYSQDVNRNIGEKRCDRWNRLTDEYPISLPNNMDDIAVLLGKTCFRIVSRRGIEIDTLRYNSDKLNRLLLNFSSENNGFKEHFKVKYDPQDLGEIYVYDHIISKVWIKVPCVNYRYAKNLSEWEHNAIKAYARKTYGQVDEEDLAKSKAIIRKMFENGSEFTPKQTARANKVNSDTAIANRENTNILNKLNTATINSENISDFGSVVKADSVIIPEVFSALENSSNNRVVNIKDGNKSKKAKKSSQNNMSRENYSSKTDSFTTEDFSGFGIISGDSEVTFDGQ